MASISLQCAFCQIVCESNKMYLHPYMTRHICMPCNELLLERVRLRKVQKEKEYRQKRIKNYREERRENIKEDNREERED
jgi:hypothetical protein